MLQSGMNLGKRGLSSPPCPLLFLPFVQHDRTLAEPQMGHLFPIGDRASTRSSLACQVGGVACANLKQ